MSLRSDDNQQMQKNLPGVPGDLLRWGSQYRIVQLDTEQGKGQHILLGLSTATQAHLLGLTTWMFQNLHCEKGPQEFQARDIGGTFIQTLFLQSQLLSHQGLWMDLSIKKKVTFA